MNTIRQILHKLQADFIDSTAITKENIFWKIGIFLAFIIAFTLLFYYLRKSRIITNTMQNTYNELTKKNLLLSKNDKKLLKRDGLWTKWLNLYTYSRIDKIFTFLTPELWLAAVIVFGSFIFLISLLFIKDLFLNVLLGFIASGLLFFFEMMLSFNNYQKVDKDLIQFLNMLGSYSLSTQEVTSVFRRVARFVDDPLKTVMIECYEEARTSGKPDEALRNMANKIEHPQFKEIIKNLEIAMKYSGDFTTVVKSNRQIIQNYMAAKQEKKNLASESMLNMFIMAIALFVSVYFMGILLNMNIFKELFEGFIGRIVMLVEALCFIFMFWKVYTVNK